MSDVWTVPLADDERGLSSAADALDIIGDAWGAQARSAVLPATRLAPEFFDLSTGLAGEFLQKFANYQIRIVIVGDISEYTAKSEALKAFVYESNLRVQVNFAPDLEP